MSHSLRKKNGYGVLIFLALLASIATFCLAADEPPKGSLTNQSVEFVMPTESDRQSAQRFTTLVKELDQPFGLARELINSVRNGELTYFPATLESTNPVHPRMLARARHFVQGMLPQLEAARTLTPPRPHPVAAVDGKITIDGKLDELSWKRALEAPIQFQRVQKASRTNAVARLLWDSEFLYIGFSVLDSDIVAPIMERDGQVWKYDCVELFLMPDKKLGGYWEIEISPTGSVLDYLCTKYPDRWGSDVRTGETLKGLQIGRTIRGKANQAEGRDDGYIIEVAVPLDQLPGISKKPAQGDRIYALLGHVNNSASTNHATTSLAQVPFLTWFHNVWAYQPLVFADVRGRFAKGK